MRGSSRLHALWVSGSSALLLAACGPEGFERRITEGSFQGFTIGSSGPEAYELFRIKRLEKGKGGSPACGGEDPDGSRIAAAGASYGLWGQWVVRRSLGPDSTDKGLSLWFQYDTLRHANVWGMGRPGDLVTGMRWDSALSVVKRVARDSLRDSLNIALYEKNFDKGYDPCLVDTAFGPGGWVGRGPGTSPVEPMTRAAAWHLTLGGRGGCGESLTLYFRGDTLFEILHVRYCNQGGI
jgi:hypothetical protein